MDNRDTCAFFVLFFLFLLVLPFGQLWWYKMIHHTRRKRIEICAARTNSQIMHTRCKRIKTCAERKKVAGPASQPTSTVTCYNSCYYCNVVPFLRRLRHHRHSACCHDRREWKSERKKERENPGIISSSCSPSSHYSYFRLLTPHPDPWLDWGTGTQWKSVFFSPTIHHSLFIFISLISNYKIWLYTYQSNVWNSRFIKYLYHYGSNFFWKDFYIIIILIYDEPYLCPNPLLQNAGVVH